MHVKSVFSIPRLAASILVSIYFSAATWAVQTYEPEIADPLTEIWRWNQISELSGKGILCMVEAKDKSMWFGMEKGALHYDGLHWTTYTLGDSLSEETVLGLLASKDGKIYASTKQGIYCFEQGRWEKIFSYSPVYDPLWRISSIIEASDGSIWAGLPYGTLRIQDSKYIFYTQQAFRDTVRKYAPDVEISLIPEKAAKQIEADIHIYSVCEDREGNILFGFLLGGILQYNAPNHWRFIHQREQRPQITQTRDGNIWVISDGSDVSDNGPWFYDSAVDTEWHHIDLQSVGGSHVNCSFVQTGDGAIWVAGFGNFHVYKKNKWYIYNASNTHISMSSRMFLYESSDGTVWIYEYLKDVYKMEYTDARWVRYLELNFQFEAEDGSKWFISADNGVIRQNHGKWIRYGTVDSLIDAPSTLLCTRKGQIWAAGSHEQNSATAYFDGKTWHKKVHYQISWSIDHRAAFEAFDGSLYFAPTVDHLADRGDRSGVMKYNPFEKNRAKAWTYFEPSLAGYSLYGIGQTADGTIWFGQSSLRQFDGERSTIVSDPSELRKGFVECIENSENNHLWVGSRSYGAFYYNGEIWENYTVDNGLKSNTIISLLPVSDTTVYAATDKDISYFDGWNWVTNIFPEQMTMTREGGTLKMSRDGTLWINKSSRAWFRRSRPGSHFTPEMLSNYWTVGYHPDHSAPQTEITMYEPKIAQPGNAHISWRGIDAWNITPDEKLQYSYRVDNGEWSPFSYETSHMIVSPGSGKHTFEVKARDQDFNIDPTPAHAQFKVIPPVWRQPWFIAIIVLMLTIIAYLIKNMLQRDKKINESNIALIEQNRQIQNAYIMMNNTVKELNESVNKVALMADDVAAGSNQISLSSGHIAEGAGNQAASYEEISSSLTEMTWNTSETVKNVKDGKGMVDKTLESTAEGIENMEELSNAINNIKTSAEKTHGIINAINDIADQTNLLALNAAIEAARAGDAGRGFAVVADEVGKLAARSTEAVSQTEDLLKEAEVNAGYGVDLNRKLVKSLDKINGFVNNVNNVMSKITTASEQQSLGIEQIQKTVEETNKVSQQNTDKADDSAAASKQIANSAEELRKLVTVFKTFLDDLARASQENTVEG